MAMPPVMPVGDEPGHGKALGRSVVPVAMTRENELTGSSECGPGNDMTYVQLSGPKDRRSPRLRPMMKQGC